MENVPGNNINAAKQFKFYNFKVLLDVLNLVLDVDNKLYAP